MTRSQWEQYQGKARAELYRGCGLWPLQEYPCNLEPPWEAYDRQALTVWDCYINDWTQTQPDSSAATGGAGVLRDLLSSLAAGVTRPEAQPDPSTDDLALPELPGNDSYENLVPITIEQFPDDEATIAKAEQLLLALPALNRPVSFEIIGVGPMHKYDHDKTIAISKARAAGDKSRNMSDAVIGWHDPYATVQFVADRTDAAQLTNLLLAHYPNSAVVQGSELDYCRDLLVNDDAYISTLGLEYGYTCPITTFSRLDTDPLTVAIAALDHLGELDWAMLQIIFQPATFPWSETAREAIQNPYQPNEYIFNDISDKVLADKFGSPLFAVSIRLLAKQQTHLQQLFGWAEQFAAPPQRFIEAPHESTDSNQLTWPIEARCAYRPGMLLNTEELASLVHLPASTISSERLRRVTTRTKAAPAVAKTPDPHSVLLGYNTHRGQKQKVYIPGELREQHCYLFGKTGSGKTTLIDRMIWQDLHAGHGVGLIDPHGDLFDRVLRYIPKQRIKDVVIFDPTDRQHPPAFNILQITDPLERDRVASETVRIMKGMDKSWGPRLDHYLRSGLLTLMYFRNATIHTLQQLYVDESLRRRLVGQVPDTLLRDFWNKEFFNRQKTAIDPIMTRLGRFLSTETVRNIVCQKRSKYDFDDIINTRKILLVKLPAGLLPEDAATLLGACLVAKLISAAFRRLETPEADRVPFYLYLDEFQRFMSLSSDFDVILSETRKYKLILAALAHQFTGQLSLKMRQAIFGNVGTKVLFQVGPQDAPTIKSELGEFTTGELQALGRGQALVSMTGADQAFNLQTYGRPEPEEKDLRDTIINWSRQQHCGQPIKFQTKQEKTPPGRPKRATRPAAVTAREQPGKAGTAEPVVEDTQPTKSEGKPQPKQAPVKEKVETVPEVTPTVPDPPPPAVEQPDLIGGHDDPTDDFV